MSRMNPHEVSEADWADEVGAVDAAPAAREAPTREEAGDEASLRDDDSDERVVADEEARLADAELRGTGGSYPER